MKKSSIVRLVLYVTLMLNAGKGVAQVTMKDLWLAMPDSVLPYLNESMRRDHIDFITMNLDSEVKNLLEGKGVMDTLSVDYCHVRLNEKLTWQLMLLPLEGKNDSVICSIKTYHTLCPESEVSFFNLGWTRIENSFGLPSMSNSDKLISDMTQKPDTMSLQQFAKMKEELLPVMVEAVYSPFDKTIELRLSGHLTSVDAGESLDAIIIPKKYKWNGKEFIEC